VGIGFGIENAGTWQIGRIKLRVLGVDVKNGVAEKTDGGNGVDVLPEEMAGIEVAADSGPGDRAQLEQRFRAVDDEARMHFDGYPDTVVSSEFGVLDPMRRDDFVPL